MTLPSPGVNFDSPDGMAQSLTAAMRDLYKQMDEGKNFSPFVLLTVMHKCFPRFSEKSEHGGYQQQDANECWVEMLGLMKSKLPSEGNDRAS